MGHGMALGGVDCHVVGMSPLYLPPDTRLGCVRFRVSDLTRAVEFYCDILGFAVVADDGGTAVLGAGDDRPLLILHSAPGAPKRPPGTTGLYHVAFLLPSRADLACMIRRVQDAGVAFEGFADHNVSEAAYLSDPDGNGIELYADRARDVWYSVEGPVYMTTEPLDVEGLLMAAPESASQLPLGTRVGHVSLRVSSLEAAEAFYVDLLGMEVTTRRYPGALFFAASGYHHHVGVNVWGGVGLPHPPPGAQGLLSFEVIVPDQKARQALLGMADVGVLHDVDEIEVRIVAE